MSAPSQDRTVWHSDLRALVRDGDDESRSSSSRIRPSVPMKAVPCLVMTYDELIELPLEPNDAFVLSLMDGQCTVESILDMAALPHDDVVAIVRALLHFGAIELHDSP